MKSRLLARACLAAAVLASPTLGWALPGGLDPSFGSGGKATFDFTPNAFQGDIGSRVLVQPDGKILTIGQTTPNLPVRLTITRHNADGTLDGTFGSGGAAYVAFTLCDPGCVSIDGRIGLQPDGKIIVAGTDDPTDAGNVDYAAIGLARLTASGQLDTTFGTNGVRKLMVQARSTLADIAVQPDGSIVVAGDTGNGTYVFQGATKVFSPAPRWLVARLTSEGVLDNTFSDDGLHMPAFGDGARPVRVLLQSGGVIAVGGYNGFGASFVERLTTTGSPLSGAIIRLEPSDSARALRDMSLAAGGRMWAVGAVGDRLVAQHLEADGTPVGAPASVTEVRGLVGASIVAAPDGGAYVAGHYQGLAHSQVLTGIRKAISGGGFDGSFGDGGSVNLAHQVADLAVQADGRVVTVGSLAGALNNNPSSLVLARIDPAFTPFVANEWLRLPNMSRGIQGPLIPVTVTNKTGAARTYTFQAETLYYGTVGQYNAYSIVGTCTNVAPGASCTVHVAFDGYTYQAPSLGYLSPEQGRVTITGDDATSAVVRLELVGEHALVTHYYRSILRREPDDSGYAYWMARTRQLDSLAHSFNNASNDAIAPHIWYSMAQSFFRSGEYAALGRDDAAFVTDLYRTFFDRAPDAGGLAYWTGELAQGLSRDAVLTGFTFSPEFVQFNGDIFTGGATNRPEVDIVMDFYRGFLGRVPDDGGLGHWVAEFQTAQCNNATLVFQAAEQLSNAFLNGSEYAARGRSTPQFVSDLYDGFVRRGADRSGLQAWVNAIDSGQVTRDQARRNFMSTPEFNARVQAVVDRGCRF